MLKFIKIILDQGTSRTPTIEAQQVKDQAPVVTQPTPPVVTQPAPPVITQPAPPVVTQTIPPVVGPPATVVPSVKGKIKFIASFHLTQLLFKT